jgi:hypothetical protein
MNLHEFEIKLTKKMKEVRGFADYIAPVVAGKES